MSSIGGISGGAPQVQNNPAATQKAAAAKPVVKDADGDFDGTRPGGSDAKDFGKGVKLDRTA